MRHHHVAGTITALCLLFLGPWMLHDDWSSVGLFWLPWPIGGVLCGIASLIIQLVKDYRRRNDDGQAPGSPGGRNSKERTADG